MGVKDDAVHDVKIDFPDRHVHEWGKLHGHGGTPIAGGFISWKIPI
jgi:hypothetical protein